MTFTDDFRIEMSREIAALRYDGWKFRDISARLGLTISSCRALLYYSDWAPPEWPKTVTKIAPNGCWWVVREAAKEG